jgi:hypothetical protein
MNGVRQQKQQYLFLTIRIGDTEHDRVGYRLYSIGIEKKDMRSEGDEMRRGGRLVAHLDIKNRCTGSTVQPESRLYEVMNCQCYDQVEGGKVSRRETQNE